MTYRLEIEIQGLPKRTNNAMSNWRGRHVEAKKWKYKVALACVRAGIPKKPLEKAHLTLIRYSSMVPDYDGLVSSFKHTIDGLIEIGVLANDKMSNIGMPAYSWEKVSPKKGMIKIIVEERTENGNAE